MSESKTKKYSVVHLDDVTPVPCPCGMSQRAFTDDPDKIASLHVVDISVEARTHYHKKLTEIYYILEGATNNSRKKLSTCCSSYAHGKPELPTNFRDGPLFLPRLAIHSNLARLAYGLFRFLNAKRIKDGIKNIFALLKTTCAYKHIGFVAFKKQF